MQGTTRHSGAVFSDRIVRLSLVVFGSVTQRNGWVKLSKALAWFSKAKQWRSMAGQGKVAATVQCGGISLGGGKATLCMAGV